MVFCNDRLAYSDGSCPAGDLPRHPSQLYEALLEGVVLFAILRYASHRLKWLQRPGAITGLFLVLYAVFRTVLEFVREPDYNRANLPLGLTMGMILSLPMALGGAWLLWRALKAPAPELAPAPVVEAPAPAPKPPAAKTKRAAKPKA